MTIKYLIYWMHVVFFTLSFISPHEHCPCQLTYCDFWMHWRWVVNAKLLNGKALRVREHTMLDRDSDQSTADWTVVWTFSKKAVRWSSGKSSPVYSLVLFHSFGLKSHKLPFCIFCLRMFHVTCFVCAV